MKSTDRPREMWFREERFDRHPEVAEAARELAGGGVVTEDDWGTAWNEVYGNDGGESGAVVIELPLTPAPASALVVAA